MPLPTIVIAGAQKSGTTSLAAAMRKHRQIAMSARKELHFFDRYFDRGIDWYADQFHPRKDQTQIAEATPSYLYEREARQRMLAILPEAKIVVILRNPVERAYSHYWHTRRRDLEDLSFEEALALEPTRIASAALEDRIRYSYVDRGHYVDQLLELVDAHDRALLHVMLLDDLKADQAGALEGMFRFCEVDPSRAHTMEEQWRNRPRAVDPELGKKVSAEYPPMDPGTRAWLLGVFAESNNRLGEWLGRDLTAWNES